MLSCNFCPSKLLSGSDPAFYSIHSVPGFCCFLCSSSLPKERLSPTRISSLHISQRTFCSFLCFIGSFLKKCKMSSMGPCQRTVKQQLTIKSATFFTTLSWFCRNSLSTEICHMEVFYQFLSYSWYLLYSRKYWCFTWFYRLNIFSLQL